MEEYSEVAPPGRFERGCPTLVRVEGGGEARGRLRCGDEGHLPVARRDSRPAQQSDDDRWVVVHEIVLCVKIHVSAIQTLAHRKYTSTHMTHTYRGRSQELPGAL